MDKLQQVKAKLEEMKAKYNQERDEEENPLHSDGNGMYWSGFFTCLKEITSIVDSLPEESANEDLEEEIDAWCQNVITGLPIVKEAARHFADWQKQQMMKDAVHAIVDNPFRMEFPNIYPDYRELKDYCDKNGIKDDDKVKLIIIKEIIA